jgi:hypothetical protein
MVIGLYDQWIAVNDEINLYLRNNRYITAVVSSFDITDN